MTTKLQTEAIEKLQTLAELGSAILDVVKETGLLRMKRRKPAKRAKKAKAKAKKADPPKEKVTKTAEVPVPRPRKQSEAPPAA